MDIAIGQLAGEGRPDVANNALMAASKGKRKRKHFIAGAIKHPGSLHRALNVPEGQKIPANKLAAAAARPSTNLKRKVALARTLAGLHR